MPKFIPLQTKEGRSVVNENVILLVQEENGYGGPKCVVITTHGRYELIEKYESFIKRLTED